ncbi:MAG: KEOPS complex subunit Cgi121, partial [Thermoplasmata archaeon]
HPEQEKMQYRIEYFKTTEPPDINEIIKFIDSANEFFQIFDLRNVYSETEILSAMSRVERNLANSKKIREAGITLILYLAFTDQISTALHNLGINSNTKHCAAVAANSRDMEAFEGNFRYFIREERPIPYDTSDDEIFEKMSNVDVLM